MAGFYDFYSVFSDPGGYRVISGSRALGEVDEKPKAGHNMPSAFANQWQWLLLK